MKSVYIIGEEGLSLPIKGAWDLLRVEDVEEDVQLAGGRLPVCCHLNNTTEII